MRKLLSVLLISLLAVVVSGCAGVRPGFDVDQYDTIRKAAVVIYTVPTKIEPKGSPTEEKKSKASLLDLAKAVVDSFSGDGTRAATISHQAFIEELNKQDLPFTVISKDEMMASEAFRGIKKVPTAKPQKEEKQWGLKMPNAKKKSTSIFDFTPGAAPEGLSQFGYPVKWEPFRAREGSFDEKQYIVSAAEALGVDAVLVVTDQGYSFSCKFCVAGNGTATTASAFAVDLVGIVNGTTDNDLTLTGSFLSTDGTAAVVMDVLNPAQQDQLYREHGRQMARVYAKHLKRKIEGLRAAREKEVLKAEKK